MIKQDSFFFFFHMMLTAGENFCQQICTILSSFLPLKSAVFYCIWHADSRHLTVQHKAGSVLLALPSAWWTPCGTETSPMYRNIRRRILLLGMILNNSCSQFHDKLLPVLGNYSAAYPHAHTLLSCYLLLSTQKLRAVILTQFVFKIRIWWEHVLNENQCDLVTDFKKKTKQKTKNQTQSNKHTLNLNTSSYQQINHGQTKQNLTEVRMPSRQRYERKQHQKYG